MGWECGFKKKKICHPGFRGLETGCRAFEFRPFGEEGAVYHYAIISLGCLLIIPRAALGRTQSIHVVGSAQWVGSRSSGSFWRFIPQLLCCWPTLVCWPYMRPDPFPLQRPALSTTPECARAYVHARTHTHTRSVKALQWIVDPCPLTPQLESFLWNRGTKPGGAEPSKTNHPLCPVRL